MTSIMKRDGICYNKWVNTTRMTKGLHLFNAKSMTIKFKNNYPIMRHMCTNYMTAAPWNNITSICVIIVDGWC